MESEEPEQTRKLFIKGLDYKTTKHTLRKVFEKWGEVVDVIVIKDSITKRSRRFGFVTYSHSSMADRAMSIRPHCIDGRQVITKRAISRDDIDVQNISAKVKSVFIIGIKNQSENDLFEHFKKFGNILNINIVTAKDSGERKGYGFIKYDNTDSVDKAILIKSHLVAGEKLDVKKSISHTDVTGYSRDEDRAYGGGLFNRSSWRVNRQNEKWRGYHNRSYRWAVGYGNGGMRGRYGSIRGGGGYGSSASMYNSNHGIAWQGVFQRWGYNIPAQGNHRGFGWGVYHQPTSNNLGPNQSYGPTNSYFSTYNNRHSGAGKM